MIVDARLELAGLVEGRLVAALELDGLELRVFAWNPDRAVAPAVWVDTVAVRTGRTTGVLELEAAVVIVTNAAADVAGRWLDSALDALIDPPLGRWVFREARPSSPLTSAGELVGPARTLTVSQSVPTAC